MKAVATSPLSLRLLPMVSSVRAQKSLVSALSSLSICSELLKQSSVSFRAATSCGADWRRNFTSTGRLLGSVESSLEITSSDTDFAYDRTRERE